MTDASKLASGSNSEMSSSSQKSNNVEDRPSISDLPTEMLETILRNVDSYDLLSCREVNRDWNVIATKFIRQRADIDIAFAFEGKRLMRTILQYPRESLVRQYWRIDIYTPSSLSFSDLVACLKGSANFPFTSFRFKDLVPAANKDMEQFLSIWGENIYSLAVKINDKLGDIEMLRVLLEKTPNLQKLHLEFEIAYFLLEIERNYIKLFPGSKKYELPNLKELRVDNRCDCLLGVVADILEAASNLTVYENCKLYSELQDITATDIIMLETFDKLHCLKSVRLTYDEDTSGYLEELPSPRFLDLPLTSLTLTISWLIGHRNDAFVSKSVKNINKLLDTSKNSLRILSISTLGLLPGIIIPKFKNLEQLTLRHDNVAMQNHDYIEPFRMFPPHFDFVGSFPNVHELVIWFFGDDEYFSPYQPPHVMPNIKCLRIIGSDIYNDKLMRMTPNVKTLLVVSEKKRPTIDFEPIAAHLTKLENLGWQLYAESHHTLEQQVESNITGFSPQFCKKMGSHFRDIEELPAKRVQSYGLFRRYCSVIDLKALKRFHLSFVMEYDTFGKGCDCKDWKCGCSADEDKTDMAGFKRDSWLYQTCLSKVSAFLAFGLIPDLDLHILNRYYL